MAVLDGIRDLWRRLSAFELAPTPGPEGARRDGPVERPWRYYWDHLPKRTAGADFSTRDYAEARQRAEEVARTTLGDELWHRLALDGHLDVRSRRYPGVTYRLRVGRRIEVVCEPGTRPPWPYPYLCINPDLPAAGARILRPPLPVRPRPRRPARPRSRPAALGPAPRPHVLRR